MEVRTLNLHVLKRREYVKIIIVFIMITVSNKIVYITHSLWQRIQHFILYPLCDRYWCVTLQ